MSLHSTDHHGRNRGAKQCLYDKAPRLQRFCAGVSPGLLPARDSRRGANVCIRIWVLYLPARNEMGRFNQRTTPPSTKALDVFVCSREPGPFSDTQQTGQGPGRPSNQGFDAAGPRCAEHAQQRRRLVGCAPAALRRGWCQMVQMIKVRLNCNAREPTACLRTGGRVGE